MTRLAGAHDRPPIVGCTIVPEVLTAGIDLLVFGGLGVDVAVRVPTLPLPVADSMTVPVDLRIGNTGAGVVLAARAIGLRVAVVDTIADDPAGAVVRGALNRAGIESVLLPDHRGTRRSVSLIDQHGSRMSLYDPRGLWAGEPPLSEEEVADLVTHARFVHVSIMDWTIDLLPRLIHANRPLSTDLHDWDGQSAYHRPFSEAADLVFVSGVRLADPATVLAEILLRGRASTAVVTLGAQGARLLEAGAAPVDVPAVTPAAPIVDTNGAGDAFVAGFIAGHLRGWPAERSARYAATVAAAACTHHGMEYPSGLLPLP
jgi:sugar/nucleoside kinase (ribokinase family)